MEELAVVARAAVSVAMGICTVAKLVDQEVENGTRGRDGV